MTDAEWINSHLALAGSPPMFIEDNMRLPSGRLLHYLCPGYIALVNRRGEIVSERKTGHLYWWAKEPNRIGWAFTEGKWNFLDDVHLVAEGRTSGWAFFNYADEQLTDEYWPASRGDTLIVHFKNLLQDDNI